MSTRSPPQYNSDVRELLRKRGEPIPQSTKLQRRDGCVRMTLMRAALDCYDDIPVEVTQYYDPDQHAVVIPLPEPDESNQSDLCEF